MLSGIMAIVKVVIALMLLFTIVMALIIFDDRNHRR